MMRAMRPSYGTKYKLFMNFQQYSPSNMTKQVELWLNQRLTIAASKNWPILPDCQYILLARVSFPLKYLNSNVWRYSCRNHRIQDMQQAKQKPCQKALTVKTQSWLAVLSLRGERRQMDFLSHSCTLMFQLLIFALTCGDVSKTHGSIVLMRLKLDPSQLAPAAWTADMLSFHAKQYLHLTRQIERVEQRKMQPIGQVQNQSVFKAPTGTHMSPSKCSPAKRPVSARVVMVMGMTSGMAEYSSFWAMKLWQSLNSRGGPRRQVGRKLTYPINSRKLISLVILFLLCSSLSFSGGAAPSCRSQARSEYLQTKIMSSETAFILHPPQLVTCSQMWQAERKAIDSKVTTAPHRLGDALTMAQTMRC